MIDKWADRGRRGLSGVVEGLGQQGVHLDLDELAFLAQTYQSYTHEPSVPPWIITFVTRLSGARRTMSVLNPFGGNGLTGAILGRNLAQARVDVLCRQPSDCVVPDYLRVQKVRYLYGDLAHHARALAVPYDAVASFPPMGLPKEHTSIPAPDGTSVELYDDPSLLELAQVSPMLSPQGMAIWLVSTRFVMESGQKSVRRNLDSLGLHVSAMFHVPRGSFEYTGMAAELVVLERRQASKVFVGEIPKSSVGQDDMVRRFSARERGDTPSQGRLVDLETYAGLEALESQEELDRYSETSGLRPMRFSEVVMSVDEATSDHGKKAASDAPSALVFLPRSAMTPATANRTGVPDSSVASYFQLTVDRRALLPEYLVAFLNSREGRVFRRSLMQGITVPHISKARLQSSMLYLPSLAAQQGLTDAMSRIAASRAHLNDLESRLLSDPRRTTEVARSLRVFDAAQGFGYWLESLPFPLAAILRQYNVETDNKTKYELLLQFFEALTQFLATILLSASRSTPQRWEAARAKLGKSLHANNLSMNRSTFGLWSSVYGSLASNARNQLNGKELEREACLQAFHVDEAKIISTLCASEITGILQVTNGWRNTWTGHGGAVPPEEARDRLRQTEDKLLELRNQLGTVFDDYQLILPGRPAVLHGGIHKYLAKRVMGSNALLENLEVSLNEPAESESLYCYQPNQTSGLRLLGFLELRETPQPACFFFNRTERNGGLRFVSYQVNPQSERMEMADQEELLSIMHELDASGS